MLQEHEAENASGVTNRLHSWDSRAGGPLVECLPMSLDSETNIQTSPIDAWLKHTTHIQAQFNRLIKNDSIAYMESICTSENHGHTTVTL